MLCPHCGKNIPDVPPQKKKVPFWIKLLFAVAIVGMIVALFRDSETGVPNALEKHLEAIKNGQYTEAYYAYTSKGFQESTSLEKYKEYLKNYPEIAQNKSYEIQENNLKGENQILKVLLTAKTGQKVVAEFLLIQEDKVWKISSIRFLEAARETGTSSQAKESIEKSIRGQLNTLKNQDSMKAYHDYTSKNFQNTTPIQGFKELIHSQPALRDFDEIIFLEPVIKDDQAEVKVKLKRKTQEILIQYILENESGIWKITSIQVLGQPNPPPSDVDIKSLIKLVEEQFKIIRKNQITQAYEGFVSEEFKKATSVEEFENFVKANTVFHKNKKTKFDTLTFSNNVATLTGYLTDAEGYEREVDYDLVKEDGKWKILHIQIYDLEPMNSDRAKRSYSLIFTKADIGLVKNAEGEIEKPSTYFSHEEADKNILYVNIHIENGLRGDKIELIFEHMDTKSQIAPVTYVLDASGSSVINFVFTPPPVGWPRGNYRIIARSTVGDEKSFPFSIQ